MNNEKLDGNDDQYLRDALRTVREMEIPSKLKANVLAAALDGLASSELIRPIDSADTRSQRFRLPAAIAASLLVGIGLGWTLRGGTSQSVGEVQVRSKSLPSMPASVWPANATSNVDYQDNRSGKFAFTEETYLCGIGRIQSSSKYQTWEETQ
ncbi:hypothetical protein K227x_54180 [Rubripirellula lacrimiformis]|uniref:Uncharacterized protein n=1 Tax=Rubripirellula lacrimiformis TaxID=1930273 RepID=A0A517NIN7_9BACT|nr:hypothetical protein [Rubripirellula lacrimiformis]QDT06994.1 hypothetical protein K227x_54180 [Rubripirellula lacrimiformis]